MPVDGLKDAPEGRPDAESVTTSAGMSGSVAVTVNVMDEPAFDVSGPGTNSKGAIFTSLTWIATFIELERGGIPLSVALKVIV